ncbi:MAG TPA: hypothetical protein VGN75_00025 [Kaistia sp.]|jgi:uncharacterized protein YwgA|nr:hypothetical protein [Kaistia sp.]
MTQTPECHVADIVQAAGGRLVSRIRLQKIAYLLDQLGAHSGFDYTYHHYGPYSRDLDSAVLDAEAFGLVREDLERRQTDGARYSVFNAVGEAGAHEFSYLGDRKLRSLVKQFASTNITVLELAATAHWLAEAEQVDDWESEIRRRKGSKTAGGRLEEAKGLLAKLGLPPGA